MFGWRDGKVGRYKRFYFFLFLFGWDWKSRGMKKLSLNKFTHIPLLKNNAQLKQKKVTNNHKKIAITKFIKNIKIMSKKKKKTTISPGSRKSKEKKRIEKKLKKKRHSQA